MSDVDNEPESDYYHFKLGLLETSLMVHSKAHAKQLSSSECDKFYKELLQEWMSAVYD